MTTKISTDMVGAITKFHAAKEFLRWESQQRKLDEDDIALLAFEYAVDFPCLDKTEMQTLAGLLFDDPNAEVPRLAISLTMGLRSRL